MDLYTKTVLTNTRHSDLLAEADAARLADDGRPGAGAQLRTAATRFVNRITKARTGRLGTGVAAASLQAPHATS